MTEGRLVLLLLSASLLPHTGCSRVQVQKIKCDYVLMSAYTGNPANEFNFSETARYLEKTAGVTLAPLLPHCNNMITFSFEMHTKRHKNDWDLREKLVDGSVDFLLTHPQVQACTSYVGAKPLLSYSRIKDPRLPRAKGMLLIRKGMQEKIRGYQDLAKKVIGIASWPSMILFSLHAQEMAKYNLHPWQDPAKVVIFGVSNGSSFIIEELLRGHIDAVFFGTDLLTVGGLPLHLFPNILAVCNGTFKPILEASQSMACTEERVDGPLLAMKHTPPIVSKAVVRALLNMPGGANHSANIQSKVTAWLPPADYLNNVKMSFKWGAQLEEIAPGEQWCSYDLVKSITCPAGYFKKSNSWIVNGCEKMHQECRATQSLQGGLSGCICKPCQKILDTALYPRANLSMACARLKQCMSVEQFSGAFMTLRILDVEDDGVHHHIVSYNVSQWGSRVFQGAGVLKEDAHGCNETEFKQVCVEIFEIWMPTSLSGSFLVHVLVDGNPIPLSPVWYSVTPFQCESVMEEPDKNGTCVCISSAVRVNGTCQSAILIFAYVVVPLLALASAYFFLTFDQKHHALVNQIDGDQIIVGDNAKIIGMGGNGVVVQVFYRNTKVVLKAVGILAHHNTPTNAADLISLLRMQSKANSSSLAGWISRATNRKSRSSGQVDTSSAASRHAHLGSPHGTNISADHGAAAQPAHEHDKRSVADFASTIQLSRQKRRVVKEIRALSKIRHPCITTIMGVVNLHSTTPLLVLEYMEGGNLFDFVHTQPVEINAYTVVRILQDVCYGLEFLHTARPSICHGNIKSHNILLDASQSQAKIAGFGLVQTNANKKAGVGTVAYMAPELLSEAGSASVCSDVYALGILINECLTRQMPYHGMHLGEKDLFRVVQGQLRPALPTQETFAAFASDVVCQCWSGDMRLRPDVHSVMSALKELLPTLRRVVIPAPAALVRRAQPSFDKMIHEESLDTTVDTLWS